MSPRVADRYQANLEVLARRTSAALLRAWAYASPWDFDGEGRFHQVARPIAIGAATAAVGAATAYATLTAPELVTGTPSPLIVADAGARMFTPFEVVSARLGAGDRWTDAIEAGAKAVDALGSTVVLRSARSASADLTPGYGPYVRRLNAKPCNRCISISGVLWPTYAAADFGHTDCKCVPVRAADAGDQNDRVLSAAGFTGDPAQAYEVEQRTASYRRQIRTAKARQEQARRDQLTETDPARRERLSIREQEWETRAEHAAERLRVLETGTHQLAA